MARNRGKISGPRMVGRSFKREDFACNCGCGYDTVDANLMVIMQKFSDVIGNRPIYIESGCRCPAKNKSCGGAKNSHHMQGRACDFNVRAYDKQPAMTDSEICKILDTLFGDTIFYYRVDEWNGTNNKRTVHVDSGNT
jgi:uncharacterized protein YcbK (DUF882 family)